MMGNLFAYKVSPLEIEAMDFQQIKYWSDWVDAINKEKNRISGEIKNKNA
jgi:hypothetical protein